MNTPPRVIVHEPNSREKLSIIAIWTEVIRNVRNNRGLLMEMIRISIRSQYKKSFIGVAWMFIMPMITIVVWLLLNKSGIFNPGKMNIPFPVYVMVTSTIWSFFFGLQDILSKVISQGAHQFLMSEFPHELLILEKVLVQLFYFIAPMSINFVVLWLFNVPVSWGALLLPLVLLPLLALSTALGLLFSIAEVAAVDLGRLASRMMATLIYISPIVYSPDTPVGLLATLVKWNPLTYLISSVRDMMIFGELYHPTGFWLSSLFSFVMLIISVRIFYIAETRVMERVAI